MGNNMFPYYTFKYMSGFDQRKWFYFSPHLAVLLESTTEPRCRICKTWTSSIHNNFLNSDDGSIWAKAVHFLNHLIIF